MRDPEHSSKSILGKSFIAGLVLSVVVVVVLLLLGWSLTSVEVDAGPISIGLAPEQPATQVPIIEITIVPPTMQAKQPTQTASEEDSTRLSQTPRILVVTATPMKILSTPTLNTGIRIRSKAPDKFIEDYFAIINQREYATAFALLSTRFKDVYHCCDANGDYSYGEYVEWWESIERVEVLKVEIREQDSIRATVYALLRFYYKDGRVADDQSIFQLVQDDTSGWLIDEQGG